MKYLVIVLLLLVWSYVYSQSVIDFDNCKGGSVVSNKSIIKVSYIHNTDTVVLIEDIKGRYTFEQTKLNNDLTEYLTLLIYTDRFVYSLENVFDVCFNTYNEVYICIEKIKMLQYRFAFTISYGDKGCTGYMNRERHKLKINCLTR